MEILLLLLSRSNDALTWYVQPQADSAADIMYKMEQADRSGRAPAFVAQPDCGNVIESGDAEFYFDPIELDM